MLHLGCKSNIKYFSVFAPVSTACGKNNHIWSNCNDLHLMRIENTSKNFCSFSYSEYWAPNFDKFDYMEKTFYTAICSQRQIISIVTIPSFDQWLPLKTIELNWIQLYRQKPLTTPKNNYPCWGLDGTLWSDHQQAHNSQKCERIMLRPACQPWWFGNHISAQPHLHHQLPRAGRRQHLGHLADHFFVSFLNMISVIIDRKLSSRTLTSDLRSQVGQTMGKFRDRWIDQWGSKWCKIWLSTLCLQRSTGKWVATKRFSQRQIEKEKIRYVHSRGNPRLDYVTFAAQVFLPKQIFSSKTFAPFSEWIFSDNILLRWTGSPSARASRSASSSSTSTSTPSTTGDW